MPNPISFFSVYCLRIKVALTFLPPSAEVTMFFLMETKIQTNLTHTKDTDKSFQCHVWTFESSDSLKLLQMSLSPSSVFLCYNIFIDQRYHLDFVIHDWVWCHCRANRCEPEKCAHIPIKSHWVLPLWPQIQLPFHHHWSSLRICLTAHRDLCSDGIIK